MKENGDGFVRADQIDLKSLDDQLERHLNKVWTIDKQKKKEQEAKETPAAGTTASVSSVSTAARAEWEIDPSKLMVKGVIGRGTFGTVHRGVYDGQDVAGQSNTF